MKKKILLTVAAVCLTAGVSVSAADYTWATTSTDEKYWHTLANWANAGVEATDLPTNAADTATFPYIDAKMRTVKLFTPGSGSAASPYPSPNIKSVMGGVCWTLCLDACGNNYSDFQQTFSVADINDFTGVWSSTGKKMLKLTATSGSQTLTSVYASGRFGVDVASANTTAEILSLTGARGSLLKTGPGELTVRNVVEPASLILELEEGNVTVEGKAKSTTEPTTILESSAFWLDASKTSTWQGHTYVDDDGRTRVTNWLDAAGRDLSAGIWDNSGDQVASHVKDVQPPFVSPKTSSTGLPLIDFGAGSDSTASAETYGPQAILRLPQRYTDAKELFYVAASTDEGEVFGDDTNYYLSGTSTYIFPYADPIVQDGGFAHFNGYERSPGIVAYNNNNAMPRQVDAFTTARQGCLQMAHIVPGNATARQIHYLATDRLYKSNSGGVRIGEVLIFTRTLSDYEREQVTEYLMKKWFSRYSDDDFVLANVKDATSITVPEGKIVKVGTLRATGTTFTKRGAGTLQVGRVYPEDLTITVEDGDVKLNTAVRTGDAATAPAGTPYRWFDANAANAFVKSDNDVLEWKDCRDNGEKATKINLSGITAYPYADTTRLAGKTTLTFPDKAAFTMSSGWYVREAFVVCAYTDDPSYYNIIANGYKNTRRMKVNGTWTTGYAFGTEDNSLDSMAGGACSVDGKPVRPFERNTTLFEKDRWFVAHISTTEGTDFSYLGSDGARSMTGHVSYGEVITYSTELTEEERVQTIDYLMNKWLGTRHPEYAAPAADPTLAFDGDATLSSDTGATFADVTGSGTLTKTDAGSVTVSADLTDAFTSLAVQSGTLTVSKPTAPTDDSVYHFDFGDNTTYTESYVDADGLTRVHKIADVRANGVAAVSPGRFVPSTGNYLYVTNPVARTGTTGTGVTRSYLDFLTRTGRNIEPTTSVGAGFNFSPSATATAAEALGEVHVVLASTDSATHLLTGSNSDFIRGLESRMLRLAGESAAAPLYVRNGYIAVDGATADGSYVMAKDVFHLLSFSPTAGNVINVKSIALQGMNLYAGGAKYGEIVAFGSARTAAERTWWQNYLKHKWINASAPEPVWTNELSSVSLALGATLTVENGIVLAPTVAVTSGSSSGAEAQISATRLLGIETLELEGNDTSIERLTVNGSVSFAGAVTLNVTGGGIANLPVGLHVLVSADAIENVDLTQWTIVDGSTRRTSSLVQSGNTICLKVTGRGFSIIGR